MHIFFFEVFPKGERYQKGEMKKKGGFVIFLIMAGADIKIQNAGLYMRSPQSVNLGKNAQ